ncbi:hypothetical protein [Paucibacter sp. Y2R2-4]|uniref:hypothetical protein n=1 Tax=Paucibacter sp. Y2R2-4 TaxID=2893553 RepID=UPI0021E39233|nr:hypothetical protein [Paucibacter sp. Y2R2-4]MCV2349319.1 hypothetical protein [Paucibacter sp. Y2R2-4]
MTFKVTHVDHYQRRRQMVVEAKGRKAAEAIVLLKLGSARYLAVIALRGRGI